MTSYAIDMRGDSMRERYRPGETLYVNPELPVRPGYEYVFRNSDKPLIQVRHLVEITDEHWLVRQWNPLTEYKILRAEWPAAERIIGSYTP